MRPSHRPGLLSREVDEEVVVLDRAADRVHQLNRTAALVWRHCDGHHTPEDLARLVSERFDGTPETVVDDVRTILQDFVRLGLVDVASVT
jgi:Coenzyme PQQ synthesis protein D (PqqD)